MAADHRDDPQAIEQDVERTQDAMGETVQKLEDKLNPRNMAQSLFSGGNGDTAREAWDVVRQSPLPVAMIAAGTAWLFATSEAPLISRWREELKSRFRNAIGSGGASGSGERPNVQHPAPIGPPPATGEEFDRRNAALDG
jgi:hypothetical protein